ncbi:MAG: hypothetical protein IKJ82_05430, partial [Oscillospiraceae bacterium]|nr:hypothetical protein [Oscillospiraceae bacterium]
NKQVFINYCLAKEPPLSKGGGPSPFWRWWRDSYNKDICNLKKNPPVFFNRKRLKNPAPFNKGANKPNNNLLRKKHPPKKGRCFVLI